MSQLHTTLYTNVFMNIDSLYNLQGNIMPSADKAEWLIKACLSKAGSSGYLRPGALTRTSE